MYGECPFVNGGDIKAILSRLTEKQFLQCKSGAIGRYGKWYDPRELVVELMNDEDFWGNNGGVTFSGGEPLLQMDALEEVLVRLRNAGINLCAETSLYVPGDAVKKAVRYFDELFVDVKLLDMERVESILGGNMELYVNNLDIVMKSGIMVCLRHPQIKGYTDDPATEHAVYELKRKYPQCEYQSLKEHHLGDEKCRTLGITLRHMVEGQGEEK